MNNTIKDFFGRLSKETQHRIIINIEKKKEEEIILNLYQLYFDFSKDEINIEYYVEDNNYPATIISFNDCKKMIK